jgi:hypothetical protein
MTTGRARVFAASSASETVFAHYAARDRDIESTEEFFCLVFVDFHGD